MFGTSQSALLSFYTDCSLRMRRTLARILTESGVCRSTLGSVARVREQISFHSDVGEGKRLAGQSKEEKFDTALRVIDPPPDKEAISSEILNHVQESKHSHEYQSDDDAESYTCTSFSNSLTFKTDYFNESLLNTCKI